MAFKSALADLLTSWVTIASRLVIFLRRAILGDDDRARSAPCSARSTGSSLRAAGRAGCRTGPLEPGVARRFAVAHLVIAPRRQAASAASASRARSSKLRPLAAWRALPPVSACQRRMVVST